MAPPRRVFLPDRFGRLAARPGEEPIEEMQMPAMAGAIAGATRGMAPDEPPGGLEEALRRRRAQGIAMQGRQAMQTMPETGAGVDLSDTPPREGFRFPYVDAQEPPDPAEASGDEEAGYEDENPYRSTLDPGARMGDRPYSPADDDGVNRENPVGILPPTDPDEKTPEDLEARRSRLAGIRNIGEGLGGIQFTSPGHILHRVKPAGTPHIAEDTRREMHRMDDLLTAGERKVIGERYGIELPEDSRLSVLQELLPASGRAFLSGRRADQEDERIELATRHADMREKGMGRVPDPDRRDLASYRNALGLMDKLEVRVKRAQFGPVAGRWNKFARFLGLADPETVGSAADLASAVNQYIYASTGKQLNREEMDRLSNELPQVWDSEAAFDRLLDGFRERISDRAKTSLDMLRRQGRDTSEFDELFGDEAPVTRTTRRQDESGAGGGTWEVQGPNGEAGTVPAGTDLSAYPGWERIR